MYEQLIHNGGNSGYKKEIQNSILTLKQPNGDAIGTSLETSKPHFLRIRRLEVWLLTFPVQKAKYPVQIS